MCTSSWTNVSAELGYGTAKEMVLPDLLAAVAERKVLREAWSGAGEASGTETRMSMSPWEDLAGAGIGVPTWA